MAKIMERYEMLSLRDTSARTGLSYDALRKMCLNNQIAHIRCGKKFLINWQRLCEYLDNAGISEQ